MQNNRSRVMHAAGKGELLLTETVHFCLTWDSHVFSQWLCFFHLDKSKWSDMADMTQRHRLCVCVILLIAITILCVCDFPKGMHNIYVPCHSTVICSCLTLEHYTFS